MRPLVDDRDGPPEVLRVDDVPTPTPRSDQVLVEVVATSLDLTDRAVG